MVDFLRIVLRLLADIVAMTVLVLRSRHSLEAENLVLRRQLGLFEERGMKPRRIDAATRLSLSGPQEFAPRLLPGPTPADVG